MREIKTRATRGGDPDRLGRSRAALMYPDMQPCEVCGKSGRGRGVIDRHHRDSDRLNNDPSNIAFLCRRHHQAAHKLTDGKVGGGPRPRVVAEQRIRADERARLARRMVSSGMTVPAVAAAFGVDPSSVVRWFRKYQS